LQKFGQFCWSDEPPFHFGHLQLFALWVYTIIANFTSAFGECKCWSDEVRAIGVSEMFDILILYPVESIKIETHLFQVSITRELSNKHL